MRIPYLTAEASLYASLRHYVTAHSASIRGEASRVGPQLQIVGRGATPDTCYCCSATECWQVGCFSTCGCGAFVKWRCNETKCWKPALSQIPLTS
jgi:hypothetical protein